MWRPNCSQSISLIERNKQSFDALFRTEKERILVSSRQMKSNEVSAFVLRKDRPEFQKSVNYRVIKIETNNDRDASKFTHCFTRRHDC